MAYGGSRFDDQEYKNWLRDSLALMYMKEGLEEYINNQSAIFHNNLLTFYTSSVLPCTSRCTDGDIKKDFRNRRWYMTCAVCDAWLQKVINFHAKAPFPTLCTDNTEPALWQTVPWETIKLYMPYGCKTDQSANDCDIQGVLSLFKNCQHYSRSGQIGRKDLLDELVRIRNTLFHSGSFKVSDNDVQADLKTILDFLQGMTHLSHTEKDSIMQAIQKIQQLKLNRLDLSLHKELELRALQQRQNALDRQLTAMQKEQEKHSMKLGTVETDIKHQASVVKQHGDTIKQQGGEIKQKGDTIKQQGHDIKQLRDIIKQQGGDIKQQGDTVKQQGDTIKHQGDTIKQHGDVLKQHGHDIKQHGDTGKQQGDVLKQHGDDIKQHGDAIKQQGDVLKQHGDYIKQHGDTVKQQGGDIKQQQDVIEELTRSKDMFIKFLQENGLEEDLAGFSIKLGQAVQRIVVVEQQVQNRPQPWTDQTVDGHKSYEEKCRDLQQHLLHQYGKRCAWENPVTADRENILQMYVKPSVKVIREKDEHGGLVEMKQAQPSTLTYQKIFFTGTGLCENVYITGDAGRGKTAFCNQLVLDWCKAVQNVQDGSVSPEDLAVLTTFKFLFYINLRDTETIYHVEDMIKDQLLYNASTSLDVSDLLKTETCLLILDGLDEWSCPEGVKRCPGLNKDIPGRNSANKKCVYLTTTRNWKFSVIDVKTVDVDKHLELCGIDEKSSKELSKKMLGYLERKSHTGKTISDFETEMHEKNLEDITTVPVLLLQLITLWHFGKEFSKSQLQLYCNMLDFLFERSEKNLQQKSSTNPEKTVKPKELPKCFSTADNCQMHAHLLHCLAQLAYKSLFNKQKEEALVFRSSKLEIFGISPSDISLCLQCGILSQNKDYTNYTGRYKKFSFFHKKVQEFLAAIYIGTYWPVKSIVGDLIQFCDSLDKVLEMSQVWLFIAGLRPGITREILKHLANLVPNVYVLVSRNMLDNIQHGLDLIRDIQTCVTHCITEAGLNGYTWSSVCLEDLYIDSHTVYHVQGLLPSSVRSTLKSVYILTWHIDDDLLTTTFEHLRQSNSIQKLSLVGSRDSSFPNKLLADTVHSSGKKLLCFHLSLSDQPVTDELINAVDISSLTCLKRLSLFTVTVTHEQKEQMLQQVSLFNTIKELELSLRCTDHTGHCRAKIDLSSLTQLHTLKLFHMTVFNLQDVLNDMRKISLWYVSLPMKCLCELAYGMSQKNHGVHVNLIAVTISETNYRQMNLKDFLSNVPGLVVSRCEYNNSRNTWSIDFHVKKPNLQN